MLTVRLNSKWCYCVTSCRRLKWQARPSINGGKMNLGCHPTPEAARRAISAWVKAGCPTDRNWSANRERRRRATRHPVRGGKTWAAAEAALRAHPRWTDARLAEAFGVGATSVGQVRRELVREGELPAVRWGDRQRTPRPKVQRPRLPLPATGWKPTAAIRAKLAAVIDTRADWSCRQLAKAAGVSRSVAGRALRDRHAVTSPAA